MKKVMVVFIAVILFSCSNKQAEQQSALKESVSKKSGKGHGKNEVTTLGTTATVTITNNGNGLFGINYGGATDVVWTFFRGGDTLSISGNVIPQNSLSFYLNPVSTITSTFTRTFYQAVVVTGSIQPDANGVVGADWVFNYSNVVQ